MQDMTLAQQLNQELEEERVYTRIYGVIFCIENMQTASHPNTLFVKKEYFLECLSILIKYCRHKNYTNHVDKGKEQVYKIDPTFKIALNDIQLSCINSPNEFNEKAFFETCFNDCFARFCTYHENILLTYKRRDAKIKRLKYLIENCDNFLFINKCHNLRIEEFMILNAKTKYQELCKVV